MAIKIFVVYPGGVDAGTADYPDGVPRDVTAPSAGDGTPWAVALIKDMQGFTQGLLARSSIVASGNPDTVLVSDYADAMDVLYGLPMLSAREGLLSTWDSGSLLTTGTGKIRNQGDTRWLTLAASLQKNVTLTWVEGPAVGGLADTVVLAQGYLRKFLANKADFSEATIVWDTDIAAANFFASATAIAAGYTDPLLYRRIGYTAIDAGLVMPKVFHKAYDPELYRYDLVSNLTLGLTAITANRLPYVVDVPPGMLWRGTLRADPAATWIGLVTTADQTDSTPTTAANHNAGSIITSGGREYQQMEFEVDASSQLFVRSFSASSLVNFHTEGWRDNLLVP